MAALRADVPVLGVYLVNPSRNAWMPASIISSGVSKSGSPAAKPMTCEPGHNCVDAMTVCDC